LTREEKEAALKEMMSNAEWREGQRAENVARYRDEEEKEQESSAQGETFIKSVPLLLFYLTLLL